MRGKKKLLIFADWFAPGFRGGGITRSTVNVAVLLKDVFDVFVFTRAEDFGVEEIYEGIETDKWELFDERINIFYCSKENLSFKTVKKIILDIQPDTVYLNNLYSYYFTWIPVWLNNKNHYKAKVVLATRGHLEKKALQKSKWRKKFFLMVAKNTDFFGKVVFQAVARMGVDTVKAHFKDNEIKFVSNFPIFLPRERGGISKKEGELSALFVGRVSPEKNILWLLKAIENIDFQFVLEIAGGIEDEKYWQKCLKQIESLPKNITVNYLGEFQMNEVCKLYQKTHILVHPTKSEGFGHVIIEALSMGRPVLISNGTPWNNMEKRKAGWNFSLDSPTEILLLLDQIAGMNDEMYSQWSAGALEVSNAFFEAHDFLNNYIDLFS